MCASLQEISRRGALLPYTGNMNFLAHLHLATLAGSSLLGNLMADYVRGNPDGQYSREVVAGIRLHRRVDAVTDSHPEVRAARQFFSADYRRVAPIALDVLWDHFLSRHWSQMVPEVELQTFLRQAEQVITPQLPATPEPFQDLNRLLWRDRWMERYAERHFLSRVLDGMAARRPRLHALSGIFPEIEAHYQQLEHCFFRLYPSMMNEARNRFGLDIAAG
ncbi:acyl carrier protein phosphodiesterase [Biostraticola tofi]|uniref:Acyl carrier protein phosphodiesterase n=2 Tax=Biostraticola tofi TaxID=466109 RepID=A0A4R3YPP7_9GAMM|nr:acyl carrier protein phosphodiesterase [Biostraticola tofi]